jgi:hypothetical protein
MGSAGAPGMPGVRMATPMSDFFSRESPVGASRSWLSLESVFIFPSLFVGIGSLSQVSSNIQSASFLANRRKSLIVQNYSGVKQIFGRSPGAPAVFYGGPQRKLSGP